MIPSLTVAAINLGVALGCGALIGSERQVRQRMAGLRTNALVALGAAAFVIFSTLFPAEVSPTRVAAQVVSGIGFLGAGIIFRDGFNVHGLNTAATLWCSAAVGLMAGAGFWPHALLLTGFVVFVNLGLRPFVKWLKKKTRAGLPILRHYAVTVTGAASTEGELRALILRTLGIGGLHVTQIEMKLAENGETVTLVAQVSAEGMADLLLEQAAARIAVEPGLRHVAWHPADEN